MFLYGCDMLMPINQTPMLDILHVLNNYDRMITARTRVHSLFQLQERKNDDKMINFIA